MSPVTGSKRRSFQAVRYEEIDIPGKPAATLDLGMTEDGQIKLGIVGRSYTVESVFRGGQNEREKGTVIILRPDKR